MNSIPTIGLPGRPGERTSGKDMEVDVKNRLSRRFTVVHDQSVSRFFKSFLLCNFPGHSHHVTGQRFVFPPDRGRIGNVSSGNYEDMNGSLGVNITKGDNLIVLIHR